MNPFTAWWKAATLEVKALAAFSLIAIIVILALWVFHPKTTVAPVPEKQAAAVTSTAVNVAASETSAEASTDSYVAQAKAKVHATKDAQDTEGDAGSAGIDALCGLREYAGDPACGVQRSNP